LNREVRSGKIKKGDKKAYYTEQRNLAEEAANKGDSSAAETASKIYRKRADQTYDMSDREKAVGYGDQSFLTKKLGVSGRIANAIGKGEGALNEAMMMGQGARLPGLPKAARAVKTAAGTALAKRESPSMPVASKRSGGGTKVTARVIRDEQPALPPGRKALGSGKPNPQPGAAPRPALARGRAKPKVTRVSSGAQKAGGAQERAYQKYRAGKDTPRDTQRAMSGVKPVDAKSTRRRAPKAEPTPAPKPRATPKPSATPNARAIRDNKKMREAKSQGDMRTPRKKKASS
jgi:hypothetical protein